MTVSIEGDRLVGRVWSHEAAPGAEVELGSSQGLVDTPVVKARGEGWVVLVDRVVDENHLVEVYQLGADGRSIAPALALPPIAEAGVSFVDLALFETGALVLVERRDDERVSLSVQPLGSGLDRTTGPLRPVFEGALAWGGRATAAALSPPDASPLGASPSGVSPLGTPASPLRGGAATGFHAGSTVMITGATRIASAAL
jgi:hypothetical protein